MVWITFIVPCKKWNKLSVCYFHKNWLYLIIIAVKIFCFIEIKTKSDARIVMISKENINILLNKNTFEFLSLGDLWIIGGYLWSFWPSILFANFTIKMSQNHLCLYLLQSTYNNKKLYGIKNSYFVMVNTNHFHYEKWNIRSILWNKNITF